MDIRTVNKSKLNPAQYNPRKDLKPGDIEYEKLKKSILAFGEVDPIVWNEKTGNIVGGHQRFKVLCEMGQADFDVSVVSLSVAKEGALNVALNNKYGEWDYPKLKDLLVEIDTGEFGIELTGFDEKELGEILGNEKSVAENNLNKQTLIGSDSYGILITCKDEHEQAGLLERFTVEGIQCKALIL